MEGQPPGLTPLNQQAGTRTLQKNACDPARHGFLLIEVVLAMSILLLVALGVYKIIQATVEATAEVRRSHLRDREISGVIELTRRTLRGLPGNANLYLRVSEDLGRYYPELVLENSPEAFAIGATGLHFGPQVLAVRPQLGGLFTLALLYEPELSPTGQIPADAPPMPPPVILVSDLRSAEWSFYDERSALWVGQWEDPGVRPRLIRLTLGVAGIPDPFSAVFFLPEKSDQSTPPAASFQRGDRAGEDEDNGPQPAPAPEPGPQLPGTPRVITPPIPSPQ